MFRSCLPGLSFPFDDRDNEYVDDADVRGGDDRDTIRGKSHNTDGEGEGATTTTSIRSILTMDPSTGAPRIPSYVGVSRADRCPLLKSAWGQDWDALLRVCVRHPEKTLHVTRHTGRTALHLATFDRRCPLRVARALLRANRHMIAVRDSNHYTPLHILAFFSAASVSNNTTTTTAMDGGNDDDDDDNDDNNDNNDNSNDAESERALAEAGSVMSLFCDTAIMVEQELGRARARGGHHHHHRCEEEEDHRHPSRLVVEGSSPLYLAAKKGAHLSILEILLDTRSRTSWIAPSTGGEPYWYENGNSSNTSSNNSNTSNNRTQLTSTRRSSSLISSFSSPLEILLREDRLRSTMNASYYRNEARLLGEEEDGNLMTTMRNRDLRGRRTASPPLLSSTSSSSLTGTRRRPKNRRRRVAGGGLPRSPMHPDEILGAPHLARVMRKLAIDRCRRDERGASSSFTRCARASSSLPAAIAKPRDDSSDAAADDGDDDEDRGNANGIGVGDETPSGGFRAKKPGSDAEECDNHPRSGCAKIPIVGDPAAVPVLTQSQRRCLELWEKCIELLVRAGADGIPRLVMVVDENDAAAAAVRCATPEGGTDDDDDSSSSGGNGYPIGSPVPYGILHACVSCKVPVPSLVEIAAMLFPEQVYQRDVVHGMTPLHHVLRAEHRYSYATSNLLSILLKGGGATEGSGGVRCGAAGGTINDNNNRDRRHQQQSDGSADYAESSVTGSDRMPRAPSLSNRTAVANNTTTNSNNSNSEKKDRDDAAASRPRPFPARYFKATALVPFPAAEPRGGGGDDDRSEPSAAKRPGPIPLVFAISRGLPMEGVIRKLLEADSHESLRTVDPVSRLPPFALVATRVRPSYGETPNGGGDVVDVDSSPSTAATTTTASGGIAAGKRDPPNDVLAAAIGCTISAFSAGDGAEARSATSPSALADDGGGGGNVQRATNNNDGDSEHVYRLDDVYGFLRAHPQVLAQYEAVKR